MSEKEKSKLKKGKLEGITIEKTKDKSNKPLKCKKCRKKIEPEAIEQSIKFYAKYHWEIGETGEVWIICTKCENEVKLIIKCVELNNNRIGFMLLEHESNETNKLKINWEKEK